MQHTVYFLVAPNAEALRELPIYIGCGMIEILLEPLLTSLTFVDRSLWRIEEVELAIKRIYVARMSEYKPISEDSVAKRILGSDEVPIQLFNRWCARQTRQREINCCAVCFPAPRYVRHAQP